MKENIYVEENFEIVDDCTSVNFKQDLHLIVNKAQTLIAELEELENRRDSETSKIDATFWKTNNQVKIDVGGKVFEVSKKSLMLIPNTYFYELMENSDKFEPLDDGTYFIERNHLVFEKVLDYLQTGKLDITDLTSSAIDMLKDDFDYYCIPVPDELKLSPLFNDTNSKYYPVANNLAELAAIETRRFEGKN